MTDSPPSRSEGEYLLDTGKVWEELHLVGEVEKKGHKLKRLIREVHIARVEYGDAIINYQKQASKDTEFSRVLADDIAQEKALKMVKNDKQLPICGPRESPK